MIYGMNVYGMYAANRNRVGFWIQRNSWGRTIARVVRVNGKTHGSLPGVPPYHGVRGIGSPKAVAEYYDLGTAQLKNVEEVRCPATYAYGLLEPIDLPEWFNTVAAVVFELDGAEEKQVTP